MTDKIDIYGRPVTIIDVDPTLRLYSDAGLAIETQCAEAMRTRHVGSVRPHFSAPLPPLSVERWAGEGCATPATSPAMSAASARWLRWARLHRAWRTVRT